MRSGSFFVWYVRVTVTPTHWELQSVLVVQVRTVTPFTAVARPPRSKHNWRLPFGV